MAEQESNEVLSYDVDFLEAFISRLDELISGFEEPAKHVREVGTVFHAEASKGVASGQDAKVFAPLGKAVDVAVGKIGSNLQGLVEHLTNDRNRLRRELDAALAADSESAHGIRQTLSKTEVYT